MFKMTDFIKSGLGFFEMAPFFHRSGQHGNIGMNTTHWWANVRLN